MEDWKLDRNPRGIVNVQSFWLRQLYLWSFLEMVIIQTNDLTLDFRDIILNQHNQTCVLQEPPKQHENLWMYGHNGFVWEVLWNPLWLKLKLKQQHHEHNCTEMKAECNLHWKAAMTLKHHSFLSVYTQLYLWLYLCVVDVAIRFWSSTFWLVLSRISFANRAALKKQTVSAQRTLTVFLRAIGYNSYAMF